jgi:hypothetical protein
MSTSKQRTISMMVRLSILAILVIPLTLGTGQMARAAASPAPVELGLAGSYAILTKSGVTNVPTSAITGNIGTSPIAASAITGFSLTADATNRFSTSAQVTGKVFAANYAAPTPANLTTAVSNMEAAYSDAAGRAPDYTELHAGILGGQTLVPGVYKWSSGVSILSDATISGTATDVWIFQIAGDLTVGSGAQVLLSGGADPKNIFWQVGGGTGVEIGTTAHVEGNILAAAAIHLRTGASLNGRALAQTAVTLDQNVVVAPGGGPLFADVPVTGKEWMQPYIEMMFYAGITTGCGANPLIYCPEDFVTRAEMAVFLLRAKYGPGYAPPAAGHYFLDVPVTGKEWMEPWIDQYYREGMTSGCGAGNYCPENNVTRAEVAVFVLRALHGGGYAPPAASGFFADVPVTGKEWMEPWIIQFANEGITTGCGGGNYCPENNVTRAEIAVFIGRAYGLYP